MKTVKYICILIVAGLLSSCNDFLEQMPDDRTVIDTPTKVKELLVTAYPRASYIDFCEAMTDNAGDKLNQSLIQTPVNEQAYYWENISSHTQDTPSLFWSFSYAAISSANHALDAIENADNPEEYAALKGEALVARAYNHFMLVSLFSQRYNPAVAERDLGIPYVTAPETVVYGNYKRENLAKVYELIEKDLTEGLSLIRDEIYDVPKYHFTESAAYAFASRFYLTIGKWQEAYESAKRVLGLNLKSQLRNWEAYMAMDFDEIKKTYTHYTEPANILLAGVTSVLGRYNGGYRYAMTPEIRDRLFKSGNVVGADFLYKIYGQANALNIPKFEEHFRRTGINTATGIPHVMAPLLTMEEVLFNKMEASVMLGGKYEEIMQDINTFFSTRIMDYDESIHTVREIDFEDYYRYANPAIYPWFETDRKQEVFLKGILDLKRREFIQEGMRWFDIKRFNIEVRRYNEDGDLIDMLRKNDARRAIQIPSNAVAEGIEPNPR